MPRSQRGGICPPREAKQPQDLCMAPSQLPTATALRRVEKRQQYLFTENMPVKPPSRSRKGKEGTRAPSTQGGGPGLHWGGSLRCRLRPAHTSTCPSLPQAGAPWTLQAPPRRSLLQGQDWLGHHSPSWPPLPEGSHAGWASGTHPSSARDSPTRKQAMLLSTFLFYLENSRV